MRTLFWLGAAALAAAGGAGLAQTTEAPDTSRTVQLELREGGQIVAAPTLRMQIGRSTAVASGNYSFRVRMERAAAPDGANAPYVVRSSLYRSDSGALVGTPAVTVLQGEQGRLRFAGSDGRDLSLAVLVR